MSIFSTTQEELSQRGEHQGVSIDVTRTAQGEVRVRYLDSGGAHAYAVYGRAGASVQILGGESESERLNARNAAFALAGRIGQAVATPGPSVVTPHH